MEPFFAFILVIVVIVLFIVTIFASSDDVKITEERTNEYRIQEFRGVFTPQVKVIVTKIQGKSRETYSEKTEEKWYYLDSNFKYKIHKSQTSSEGFIHQWDHHITRDEAVHFETLEACENFIKNYGAQPKYHKIKV